MNRVWIMGLLLLAPRILVAQEIDLESLVGEDWYGLYFNGQKAGFAKNAATLEEDGSFVMTEDGQFRILMVGQEQNMQFTSVRRYAPDGKLVRMESEVRDAKGVSRFVGEIVDGQLKYTTTVGGADSEQLLPDPNENVRDVLAQIGLTREGAQIGDEVSYSVYDPILNIKLDHVSRIVGFEERIFDGARTKVYVIKTNVNPIGMESKAYVAEDGTVLEDIFGGIITMRLEPRQIAQDVNYNNDVIVSNAALVERAIDDPRGRNELRLRITGPLKPEHLFNDERQRIVFTGNDYDFTAKRAVLEGVAVPALPVEAPDVQEWLKPTPFVQSDNELLIAKAKEIVGDETDAYKVNELLCHWVYGNVITSFSARMTNSLEVLESLEGDCTEHSILFVGLARALGLPAREVAGLIYVEGPPRGFYFHQWAKVWVGKWVDVDPTFNQPLADVTHIKLAEGDLAEQFRLIPVIGQIQVEVIDSAGAPSDAQPEAESGAESGAESNAQ